MTSSEKREEELEEEYENGREEGKEEEYEVICSSLLYLSLIVVYKFFVLSMMGE